MPHMDAFRNSPPDTFCASAKDELSEPPAVVESQALLGNRQELLIRHGGRIYRLRRTRLGKLILTA